VKCRFASQQLLLHRALARFLRSRSPATAKLLEERNVPGPADPKRNVPLIDLGTVRDTLTYIRDDLQRVPALERAAELIDAALAEVQSAERRRLAPIQRSILDTRLLPRPRH
jgi:hypothetical protein